MSSKLAFITGATGFIGAQVAASALGEGYNLRLSVRKAEQIERLKEIFHDNVSRLEFVVVPDISRPQAFDDALDNVDVIFHIASPMPGKGEDLQKDYLDPAVRGTLSVMESARKIPSIKRVVIMSSILAIGPVDLFTNTDTFVPANSGKRHEVPIEQLFPEGKGDHGLMYVASKMLAHQASLDWVKEHKPGFTVATVHPTFVLGPSLIRKTADDIDGMNAFFWKSIHQAAPLIPSVIVDVRDAAELTVKAAGPDVPDGIELVASGAPTTWKDMVAWTESKYPELDLKLVEDGPVPFRVDNDELGMKWRPLEETLSGLIDQHLALQKGN